MFDVLAFLHLYTNHMLTVTRNPCQGSQFSGKYLIFLACQELGSNIWPDVFFFANKSDTWGSVNNKACSCFVSDILGAKKGIEKH